jgi:hypothetical protein
LVNDLPKCGVNAVLVHNERATRSNSGKLSLEGSFLSDETKVHHGDWEN